MGPKKSEELTLALKELEGGVFDFLTMKTLLETADKETRQLYQDDLDLVTPMPEMYLMFRKLQVFGVGSSIPFLVEGGWYDQPYVPCLALEACFKAEQQYRALLEANARRQDGLERRTEETG